MSFKTNAHLHFLFFLLPEYQHYCCASFQMTETLLTYNIWSWNLVSWLDLLIPGSRSLLNSCSDIKVSRSYKGTWKCCVHKSPLLGTESRELSPHSHIYMIQNGVFHSGFWPKYCRYVLFLQCLLHTQFFIVFRHWKLVAFFHIMLISLQIWSVNFVHSLLQTCGKVCNYVWRISGTGNQFRVQIRIIIILLRNKTSSNLSVRTIGREDVCNILLLMS